MIRTVISLLLWIVLAFPVVTGGGSGDAFGQTIRDSDVVVVSEDEVEAAVELHLEPWPDGTSVQEMMAFSTHQQKVQARVREVFHPWFSSMSRRVEDGLDEAEIGSIREEAEALLSLSSGETPLFVRQLKNSMGKATLNIIDTAAPREAGTEHRLYFLELALEAMNPQFYTILRVLEEADGFEEQVQRLASQALVNLAALERIAEVRSQRARALIHELRSSDSLRQLIEDETGRPMDDAEYERQLEIIQSNRDNWPPTVRSYSGTEFVQLDVDDVRARLQALTR